LARNDFDRLRDALFKPFTDGHWCVADMLRAVDPGMGQPGDLARKWAGAVPGGERVRVGQTGVAQGDLAAARKDST
jgi:hypothetical protein